MKEKENRASGKQSAPAHPQLYVRHMQGLQAAYPEGATYGRPDRDQVRELQGRDQEEGTGKQPHGNGSPLRRSAAQGDAEEGRWPLMHMSAAGR